MGTMFQSTPSPLRGGIKGGGSVPTVNAMAGWTAGTPTLIPSPHGGGRRMPIFGGKFGDFL